MISGKGQLAGSKKTCRQGQHFIGIFKLQVHRPPSVLLFEVRVNSIFFGGGPYVFNTLYHRVSYSILCGVVMDKSFPCSVKHLLVTAASRSVFKGAQKLR